MKHASAAALALLLVLGGCRPQGDAPEPEPPAGGSADAADAPLNKGEARDGARFAAVQYGSGNAAAVDPACAKAATPDICALTTLVRRAAAEGAEVVVLPEYGFETLDPLPEPEVGEVLWLQRGGPGERDALTHFSELARDAEVHLAVNAITVDNNKERFNALVFFDPDGRVLASHHKFELFAGERDDLSAGEGVTVVATRHGKVGLMVCADLYGDLRLHREMVEEAGADVVLVSAHWTARGAPRWPASFARDFDVPVVSANTTNGPGCGGGIFDAEGRPLGVSDEPGVIVESVGVGERR